MSRQSYKHRMKTNLKDKPLLSVVWDSVASSAEISVRASVRNSFMKTVYGSVKNSVRSSVYDSVWRSVVSSVKWSVWKKFFDKK